MKISTIKLFRVLSVLISFGIVIIACSNSVPEKILVDISIKERQLENTNNAIKVKHNDFVKLTITADEHSSFHLHGYDLKIDITPRETSILEFTANATGRFPFTMHVESPQELVNEEEHDHHQEEKIDITDEIPLGMFEVYPR